MTPRVKTRLVVRRGRVLSRSEKRREGGGSERVMGKTSPETPLSTSHTILRSARTWPARCERGVGEGHG